jgi:hypothetical protein
VLDALGPQGYLVSIGRGSVVDTEALGAALRENRIAGAGVDVYESEPKRPEPLVGLDNVLLTPHMAGWSPEATQKSVDHFLANAEGHFAGRGVLDPDLKVLLLPPLGEGWDAGAAMQSARSMRPLAPTPALPQRGRESSQGRRAPRAPAAGLVIRMTEPQHV